MLETILVILAVIAVLVAALLIYAATKPDSFRIERKALINANPEKIFPLINDFHKWTQWSPWEAMDPNMQRTYSGAESGKGAAYAWVGNDKVGSGRMEITESTPPGRVVAALDFLKPIEAHNFAEFTLRPQGESTEVTWAMYGPSPYMSKLMTIFFNMEKMVGPDFERGLAKLKGAAEG